MDENIFVSIPFNLLVEKYLYLVLENRLNIEIALNAESLDKYTYKFFKKIAEQLKERKIKTTIHLPFMDLSIGALDPWIKESSLKRIFFAIDRAIMFDPLNLVLHSGYHTDYHREKKFLWRDNLIESISKLIEICKDLRLSLSLENTFEPDPYFMQPVFEAFKGELFWCFDPAHARVFSEKNELEWLDLLYPYLKEMHCHDNLGKYDDHLAIGKGIIRFKDIFDFLKKKNIKPILTSEAHNEQDTYINLEVLKKFVK